MQCSFIVDSPRTSGPKPSPPCQKPDHTAVGSSRWGLSHPTRSQPLLTLKKKKSSACLPSSLDVNPIGNCSDSFLVVSPALSSEWQVLLPRISSETSSLLLHPSLQGRGHFLRTMEVFLGSIPKHVDGPNIERFIYALVQDECHLTTASISNTSAAVPALPINKGFYFRRVDTDHTYDFGIVTFATKRVAEWFILFAQNTKFVRKYSLKVDVGKKTPSKAFVRAIAENATVQQPSASARKQDQLFPLQLAFVGHWAANDRFSSTYQFEHDHLLLGIDEQHVIRITGGYSSVSFLPRDVRAYRIDKTYDTPTAILFELKQNPLLRGGIAPSLRSPHHFNLPSRLIHVTFGTDHTSRYYVKRFSKFLDDHFKDVPNVEMGNVQVVRDNNEAWIAGFFKKSESLGIELAFLRESLLRNELVGTSALSKTIDKLLDRMLNRGQHTLALRVLKNLVPKLEARQERDKTEEQVHRITNKLWEEAHKEAVAIDTNGLLTFMEPSLMKGDTLLSPFLHVDVTPTRVLLSGPH